LIQTVEKQRLRGPVPDRARGAARASVAEPPGAVPDSEPPSQLASLSVRANSGPRVLKLRALGTTLNAGSAQPQVVQRVGAGLAEPKLIATYGSGLREALLETDKDERLSVLTQAVNEMLSAAGVPPIESKAIELGGAAQFNEREWTMEILQSPLETDDPAILGELVGTVYHEARHAEQFFRVAQQYAAEGNEIQLYTLKLPDEVREQAVASKGDLAKASPGLLKGIEEWKESLKNPEAVLAEMQAAEFELAKQFEVFKLAARALFTTAQALPLALATNELSEINFSPVTVTLEIYRQEKKKLDTQLVIVRKWIRTYRRLPHELDAHLLGWMAEDVFQTGELGKGPDLEYQNRFPDKGKTQKIVKMIDAAVDELEVLAKSVVQVEKVDEEDFDEEFDFSLPPEVEAAYAAELKTGKKSGPEYDKAYTEALEYYQQKAKEESPKSSSKVPDKSELLEKMQLISPALSFWPGLEKDYLGALSAQVHRRTVL